MTARKLLAPILALALFVTAKAAVAAPESINGWGPYKFGMTEKQVIKASKHDIDRSQDGSNDLMTYVYVGKYLLSATFQFTPVEHLLGHISLKISPQIDIKAMHWADATAYLLTLLTEKYGTAVGSEDTQLQWVARDGSKIVFLGGPGSCPDIDYYDKPVTIPQAGV